MITFERNRLNSLLDSVERLAAGDLHVRIPISDEKDEVDALAHGINVMAGELNYRLRELQQAQVAIIQSGKLAALGEVSSGLAHELNNPLAIIRGYLEHAQLTLGTETAMPLLLEKLDHYLKKIDESVDRMTTIIQHVREFSRQSKPERVPFHVNASIRDAFILVGEQLRLRGILVEFELCPQEPLALGDKVRLEQVILNLLTNARDAIADAHGEAGGTIIIRSRTLSTAWLEVCVADNGVGMTDEIQQRMFDPFFTTKEAGRGTGLGLSISLGIVQEQGGEITCQSRPGAGTELQIRLPRVVW